VILKFTAVLIFDTRLALASVSPTLQAGDAARLLSTAGLGIATPVAMGTGLAGSASRPVTGWVYSPARLSLAIFPRQCAPAAVRSR